MAKTLQLKKGTANLNGQEKNISTAQLVRAVLDHPPKEGFTFEDLKKRQRIDAALDAAGEGDTLHLEDADFQTLKEAALAMRWIWRADFILDFVTSCTS
jgi:hypothetical protein